MNEYMMNSIVQACEGIMKTRPIMEKMDRGTFEMFVCMLIEEWQVDKPEEDTMVILEECRAAAADVRAMAGVYKM